MSSALLLRPRRGLPARPDPDALKRLYRTQVLGMPGPVDRWIVTNLRAGGSLNFLRNYMYLVDVDCTRNVRCRVERKRHEVSATPSVRLIVDQISSRQSRMTQASSILRHMFYTSRASSAQPLEFPQGSERARGSIWTTTSVVPASSLHRIGSTTTKFLRNFFSRVASLQKRLCSCRCWTSTDDRYVCNNCSGATDHLILCHSETFQHSWSNGREPSQ
jgi:hypothetical protein